MAIVGKKPIIFLPIEIKVREFDGKLLFSLIAAESGFNVILGLQKDIRRHLYAFPPGLYIDKSTARSKIKWFKHFKKLDNILCAWDEEGLIIHENTYLDNRFSPQAFEMLHKFFTWGEVQAGLIQNKYKTAQNKLVISGNPRFDMLRPEVRGFYSESVNRLKEQFGPTILINTNFGFYNHASGVEIGKRIFNKSISSLKDSFIEGWIEFQKETFENFEAMLPILSEKFKDYSIVIRPHPSENHEVWKKIAQKTDRVKVFYEGNVIEWLLAADVVIHSNCSTGVEAFLSGIPVVAFRPTVSDCFETYLPNSVSEQVFNIDELIIVLEKILLDNGQGLKQKDEIHRYQIAGRYIDALDGPLASEKIIKIIKEMNLPAQKLHLHLPRKISRGLVSMKPLLRKFLIDVKNMIVVPQNTVQVHSGKSIAKIQESLEKQKSPDISLDDINNSVYKFKQVLGRFASIQVSVVKPNCFLISNDGALK